MKTISFRGLTSGGPSAALGIVSVEGLDDFKGEASTEGNSKYHGGVASGGFMPDREIVVEHRIRVRHDPLATLRAWKNAFAPSGAEEFPLTWTEDDGKVMTCNVRVVGRAAPRTVENRNLNKVLTVRLLASDPRLYSFAEYEAVTGEYDPNADYSGQYISGGLVTPLVKSLAGYASTGGGITWAYPRPWGTPWGNNGPNVTQAVVRHDGTAGTWPDIYITKDDAGLARNIRVEAATMGGAYLDFGADGGLTMFEGAEFKVVTHPARRYVGFSDGASRWNVLSGGSDIDAFEIPPGTHSFRLRGEGDMAGVKLHIRWRDAEL